MKDYYQILGISENASQEDIKRAFRTLAFQYHPDTNPGNERQAEENFKEINEAYGVLGDKTSRHQYDFARGNRFADAGRGIGYEGFAYSQRDIFRAFFSNGTTVDELNQMFSQAGLKFDQDFLNRVFFKGEGVRFRSSIWPGETGTRAYTFRDEARYRQSSNYKLNWIERLLSRLALKIWGFVLRKLLGLQYEPLHPQNLDLHVDIELSSTEATAGCEKRITLKKNKRTRKLVVMVPQGVKSGTKIRLQNMGRTDGNKSGDLYLHVKVKGQASEIE